MTRFLFLLVGILCVVVVNRALDSRAASNPCSTKTTCSECIQSDRRCAWCQKENFTDYGHQRCDIHTAEFMQACTGEANLVFPGQKVKSLQTKPLSRPRADARDIIQIHPQEIQLQLRPNDPFNLDIEFRQAEDYPVDLYYLMDLSKSMEDDKEKLALLGQQLAVKMGSITRNFRLGFGSFVDKVVMPYVSTVPEKLTAPCTGCAAPYGFRHHMTLSENASQFEVEVSRAKVSGNLDAPEGGFDAIMQAIVCPEKIGWREKARKMLVFSTDSGFHYAGDGKLGGIVKPNDGICHLNQEGLYTESVTQDYPSLSQIRQKVSEKKVHIIFAVTKSQVNIYQQLSERLEGAYTGELSSDSSNVVDLVADQYNQITSNVELKDNATDDVQVTYTAECGKGQEKGSNMCHGLRVGDTVKFQAQIVVKSCPKDPKDWKQTFHIYPVGLSDALVVHLDMICECDCEKPGAEEHSSPKCSGVGTYECGICSCNNKRFGRFCECGENEAISWGTDETACKPQNSTVICFNRGTCSCGQCQCQSRQNPDERVYGNFCECDNFSCDRIDNNICNGKGECDCGRCICQKGWTGAACECFDSDETCYATKDAQKPCSGHGECKCGVCHCDERYSGRYCEECPTCPGKCQDYRWCVQCQQFDSGEYKHNCSECSFKVNPVKEVSVEYSNDRICVFKDEDDCQYTFRYRYDEQGAPIVDVQETKECPPPVNFLWIILAVILGIVLVGLCLLLIWKLLTTIHDRREFAKFEKERQMAKWDTGENPIYKGAVSRFQNPTYGAKQ